MRDRFEGWYYKVVDRLGDEAFSFIPGLAVSQDHPRAFMQLIDGRRARSHFLDYPPAEFAKKGETLKLGENRFSPEHLELNIDRPEIKVAGELFFQNVIPWPWPGAMGPFSFIPTLEN